VVTSGWVLLPLHGRAADGVVGRPVNVLPLEERAAAVLNSRITMRDEVRKKNAEHDCMRSG
jgi:hypothetical protein